jgi:peptidoglycan-associated lipoprotein
MRSRLPVPILLLVAGLSLVTLHCPKKKPPEAPAPPVQETKPAEPAPPPAPVQEVTEPFRTAPVETTEPPPPTVDRLNEMGLLKTVHFAFDSYELSEEARRLLQDNAKWLRDNPGHVIRVEGHCDERGTIEYNLALGERRASAVRDYLAGLGVDPSRLRIVSYGEEVPADPGHDEEAWRKNRRAESIFES